MNINLKTDIYIDNVTFTFEIYQVDDGVITGFKFDNRIFRSTQLPSDKKIQLVIPPEVPKEPLYNFIEKEIQKIEVPKRSHKKTSTVPIEISEKHCSKCDKTKPVSEFNKSKQDRTGYQSSCRICASIVNKKWLQDHKKKQPDIKPEKQPETKKHEHKEAFQWTKEKDKIILDNFKELGISGIYDKNLLIGFSLAEIRHRCQELKLIDAYGNTITERG
jgi:hypothetical protein